MTCVRTDIRTYVHEGLCGHMTPWMENGHVVKCSVYTMKYTQVSFCTLCGPLCVIMACVNIQRDVRTYIPQEHSNVLPIFVLQLLLAATKLSPCAVLLW